jgi:glutamate--cysteine ligase
MQELALHAPVESQPLRISLPRWMPKWIKERSRIEAWLADYSQRWLPPLYASVDIRHSTHKIAVIDTNLFSAGFNNLDHTAQLRVIEGLKRAWRRRKLTPQRILLIPERHTRNLFYLESLGVLKRCLEAAGTEVRIGFWEDASDPEQSQALFQQGWSLISTKDQRLALSDWVPDLAFLNHDLSSGVPALLRETTTPIFPSVELGWHRRLKSVHFEWYKTIVEEFSAAMNSEAWPLQAVFSVSQGLDFSEGIGLEALQDQAAQLLSLLREQYRQHKLTESPYLVIKADSGTYGMGIMVVRDASELRQLNRKQRNKMAVVKEGMPVRQVILQEGIPSEERYEGYAAESVMYMVDNEVVGRFYRTHPERGMEGILNAPGMLCKPVPLNEEEDDVYLQTVVARLALMAAAREQALVSDRG